MHRRLRILGTTGMVLALSTLVGCQTWIAGMTLPSPHYLEHYPQYFPSDPDFPLERELQTQIDYSGLFKQAEQGNGAVPPVLPAVAPAAQAIPAGPGGIMPK